MQLTSKLFFLMVTFFCSAVVLYSEEPTNFHTQNEHKSENLDFMVSEKYGNRINLDLEFFNEKSQIVSMRDFIEPGNKPILLTIVYYRCPSLCNFHLNGLLSTLKELDLVVGKDFEFIAVSVDPRETPELAAKKKEAYVDEYTRESKTRTGEGWHFLTGKELQIKELSQSLGFPYRWDAKINQWIHPSVAYIITPEGRVSRYLYGLEFGERELRLSLLEAANGKISNLVDIFTLFCFQFDPHKKKYTLDMVNLMGLGGLVTLLFVSVFIFMHWKSQVKIFFKKN